MIGIFMIKMLTDKRIWQYECDYSARSFKKKIIVNNLQTYVNEYNCWRCGKKFLHDMFFKDAFISKIFT